MVRYIMIPKKNIIPNSIPASKLYNDVLPIIAIENLETDLQNAKKEISTGGPLYGYVTLDLKMNTNLIIGFPITIKGTITYLKENISIETVFIKINNLEIFEITAEDFINGYLYNLPFIPTIDDTVVVSVNARTNLGYITPILQHSYIIKEKKLVNPVPFLYRNMKSTYPNVSFDNNLYIHLLDNNEYQYDLFGRQITYGGMEIIIGLTNNNGIVTNNILQREFNVNDPLILINFFNNLSVEQTFLYYQTRIKDNITNTWSQLTEPTYIFTTCPTNLNDTDTRIVPLLTNAIHQIQEDGIYAIDAYGAGAGGACVRRSDYGYNGSHSYKDAILLNKDDICEVIIGAGGLSTRTSGMAEPLRNNMGGMTSIRITGLKTNFTMLAPGGRGCGTIGANTDQALGFIPTNYKHWPAIPSYVYGTSGCDNSGQGRDGFLYHYSVDGDKGALNDCGSGGKVKIGRGNVSKSGTSGSYLTQGNSTTGQGAQWGGGGGYHSSGLAGATITSSGGIGAGAGAWGDSPPTSYDTGYRGGNGFIVMVRTNLDVID